MRIITPSVEFIWMTPEPLQTIEWAGRTAYKSEDRITQDSAANFVTSLLRLGHESVIEHASMSYRLVCDRGVSHELVRHRLFSFTQESTRYCNYGEAREILVIETPGIEGHMHAEWRAAIMCAEEAYLKMVHYGCSPQLARSVLPNALKTEVVVTGNFREWRHFFELRTAPAAHPQMREIATLVLLDAATRVPIVFDQYRKGIQV